MIILGRNIRIRLESAYFRWWYSKKPPDLYYNRLFHPSHTDVHVPLEWGCAKLVRSGGYSYQLKRHYGHDHWLSSVLKTAYEFGDDFCIPEDQRNSYSAQEFGWITQMAERGAADHRRRQRACECL